MDEILANLGSVAEGVPTTKAAFDLATKLGVNCPIITAIHNILYEKKPIKDAVKDLLEEEVSEELSLNTNCKRIV